MKKDMTSFQVWEKYHLPHTLSTKPKINIGILIMFNFDI